MNKTKALWIALESIFLLVFLILFFSLTKTRETSAWIAFFAVLIAYFVLLAVPSLVRSGNAETDNRRPLFLVAGGYFAIAFILNVGILCSQPVSTKFAVLSNLVLFALFAAALLILLLANKDTADQEERRQVELNYVKDAPLRLRMLNSLVKDPELSAAIERAAELISYSPARSSATVRQMEERILEEIGQLEMALPSDSAELFGTVELISNLAKKRNMILNAENGR